MKLSNRKNTGGRGFFTLIEILLVIGIIAILLTMLLPALKQTKDTSKKIKCLSNLQQIGLAVLTYANDNDDFMVPNYVGGTFWDYPPSGGFLAPYIKLPPGHYAGSNSCFSCPARALTNFYSSTGITHCYALNVVISDPDALKKLSRLRYPSKTTIIGDGNTQVSYFRTMPDTSNLEFPHHNGINMLFTDGHTQGFHWKDYLNDAQPGTGYSPDGPYRYLGLP